jgi:hypothetical protein
VPRERVLKLGRHVPDVASRLERYGQKLRFIVEVAASIPAFSDDLFSPSGDSLPSRC